MANRTLTIEQIYARGEREGFTAYQIAQIVNVKLREAGLDEIRPQMLYNFDRQGQIVKGQKNVTASRAFTRSEVDEFVDRYVAMRIEKASQGPKQPALVDCFANVDQVHEELEAQRLEEQLPLDV